jgi:hypothetical protein
MQVGRISKRVTRIFDFLEACVPTWWEDITDPRLPSWSFMRFLQEPGPTRDFFRDTEFSSAVLLDFSESRRRDIALASAIDYDEVYKLADKLAFAALYQLQP